MLLHLLIAIVILDLIEDLALNLMMKKTSRECVAFFISSQLFGENGD